VGKINVATVNTEVWKILAEDLSVQKDLKRGLINIRALARHLIQDKGISGSIDAVISAIRRFENESDLAVQVKDTEKVFENAIITTKSNVASMTLSDRQFKVIANDFLGDKKLKENFRLLKSKENIRIFLNQKDFELKKKLFLMKDLRYVDLDLAEMRIEFPKDVHEAVGIMSRIGQELALSNVCVYGFIEAMPEILIYVKMKDLAVAHDVLLELVS
jgi:hypothetical protein